MPDPISEFYVKIGDEDVKRVDRAIDKLHSTMKGLDPSIVKMESGFAKAGKALSGIGGIIATIGIAKFGMDIFNASVQMDKLHRMLVNVEGSQEAANKRFEQFRILAKEPVLDPFNLSRFYTGLRAINVEGDLSIRFMKGFANVMAGAGAGNEEFSRSMHQVVQMMGKGKLEGQDLRVILESFPQFAKYLKDALGSMNTEELAKSGITATEVMQKLTVEFEKQPKFAASAQEKVDNFKQSLALFESELGKNVLPRIGEFLDKLTGIMDAFGKLPEGTKNVVGTFVIVGGGLLGVAFALSLIVEHGGAAIGVLKGLAGAQALAGMAGGAGVAAGTAPFVSGLVNQYGRPISSSLTAGEKAVLGTTALAGYSRGSLGAVAGLGTAIPNLIVGAMTVGALYWGGKEIYKAFTRDFTTEEKAGWAKQAPAFTADAIKEIIKAEALANPAGLTLAEIVNLGIGYKGPTGMMGVGAGLNEQAFTLGDKIEKAGFAWEKLSQMTAKQALAYMQYIPPGKGTFTKVPMEVTGLGGIGGGTWESLSEEYKKITDITAKQYKISDVEQLAWWQAKLKLPLTLEAKQGVLNTISGLQEDIGKVLKEEGEKREKQWFEDVEAISKGKKIYEYMPTMIPTEIVAPLRIPPREQMMERIPEQMGGAGIAALSLLEKPFLHPEPYKTDIAWGKTLETQKKVIDAEFKYDAEQQKIIEGWADGIDSNAKKGLKLWDDFGKGIEEADKKQSQFWNNMKYMGLDIMDAISDKGIGQMFDKMFEESRIKEAWADYVHEAERSGKAVEMTFHEFSDDWKKMNDINMQSWKEFLQELIVEWGKMLATKLLMYGAEKLAEWAIDKATGGKAPAIGAGSLEEIGITDKNAGMTESKHWYGRGSIIADIAGLFGQNYYETHPTEYQHGGWAMKPTFAILGEREPELVIPKSKLQSGGFGGGLHIENVNISFPDADLRYVDPNVAKRLVVNAIRSAQASGEISKAI